LCIDFIPRLDVNENYLHLFPLFWTNFWYLPPFYFLLTLLFSKPWYLSLLTTIIYSFYLTELCDFNLINFTYQNAELVQFNNLLTNNLNKYHPFLFFLSTHLGFNLVYRSQALFLTPLLFNNTALNRTLNRHNNTFSLLIILALSLGGVWAFQEASWGGFWNWDSSETFGLLFLVTALYYLHRANKFSTLVLSFNCLLSNGLGLVVVYCFLQLNFDLLSHNFGIKFLHLFSNSFFYKEVILITTLVFYKTYRLVWWDKLQLFTLNTRSLVLPSPPYHTSFLFWWQVLWFNLFLLVGYSLTQLINYTIFSLFQINWFNFSIHLPPFILAMYLYLIHWFTLPVGTSMLTLCMMVVSEVNTVYILILNLYVIRKVYQVLHVVFIWTLTVNILAYKTNFLTWTFLALNSVFSFTPTGAVATGASFICDALFIDQVMSYNSTIANVTTWITYFTSNSPDMNQLVLSLYNEGCCSLYQLTNRLNVLTIVIIAPYVNLLTIAVVLTLTFLRLW